MGDVITYVGIDAHKRELHVAMLIGTATTPVTWMVENEPKAIDGRHRKVERDAPGPVRVCYEAGPCGYLCTAAAVDEGPGQLRGDRAGVDTAAKVVVAVARELTGFIWAALQPPTAA